MFAPRELSRLFLLTCLVLIAPQALASNFLMEDYPTHINQIAYKYQRPMFKQDSDSGLFTGFHELSFAINSGDRVSLVGSLPIAQQTFAEKSDTALGNMYFGARWGERGRGNKTAFSLGVYLPTSRANGGIASLTGLLSEPSRFQLFFQNVMTFHANMLLFNTTSSGLYFRGEVGPELMMINGGRDANWESALRYGGGFGYETHSFSGGIELVGSWLFTADVDQFSDSILNVATLGGEIRGSKFMPSLYYSIPLDEDYKDIIDGVLGIRVRAMF